MPASLATTFFGASGSSIGCSSWSSEAGSILATASIAIDQPSSAMSDRDLERGVRGALAAAGLQDPEPAVLDGELDVLHVAVVRLRSNTVASSANASSITSSIADCRLRASFSRDGERLRRADPGDHVLALGIDQKLA